MVMSKEYKTIIYPLKSALSPKQFMIEKFQGKKTKVHYEHLKRMSHQVQHGKKLSLINGHECRVQVKICSTSSVFGEISIQVKTTNRQQANKKHTIALPMKQLWSNRTIVIASSYNYDVGFLTQALVVETGGRTTLYLHLL